MKSIIITTLITILGFAVSAFAAIINVPLDYPTIQTGINASTDGDTVLVQPGIYVENINFNGHNIVLGSLFLTTGDTTFVLSTIIDGLPAHHSVVTFASAEDTTAMIIGFTIRHGTPNFGGGIRCMNASSPTISKNIITDNVVEGLGGAIYCENYSNPIITGNRITSNIAWGYEIARGGGIYCYSSDPLIVGNIITGNYGGYRGGGVYCDFSNPVLVGNLILENAARWGSGVFCDSHSDPFIANCLVTGNIGETGGGVYGSESSPIIINTILRENSEPQVVFFLGYPSISYSNIQGGWEGEGNIDEDPLFRDPENADFHLMWTACGDPYDSPCIDAGHPDILDSLLDCSWGLGTILSDMGAYGGGDSVTVGIKDYINNLPDRFALLQNYPNPFNPATTIRYSLPEQSKVRIEIYNILGQLVATLFDGHKQAGYHTVTWQADHYPSGIYFTRLEAGHRSESIKIVLLK